MRMRSIAAFVTAVALGSSGCATLIPPPAVRSGASTAALDLLEPATDPKPNAVAPPATPPERASGSTSNEPTAARAQPSSAPPKQAPPPEPADRDDETRDRSRLHKRLFWTGIGGLALGGAGVIAFGAAGWATREQLERAYEDGAITRDREDQLKTTGEVMNALALTSAAIGVVGLGLAAVMFALDYTKCGKLAGKRRRHECRP